MFESPLDSKLVNPKEINPERDTKVSEDLENACPLHEQSLDFSPQV